MKKENEDPNKRNQLRNWAIFTGIAFQMGATIFICAWIGKKLDERYPSNKNWFTIGFVLFGIVASVYVVLKQLKRYNE
ncbi:AtpZ/AtpI family protein [Salinimicrobium soli]|uniref:AtpZ/AtpI family protein n=1 Tax=Salinimicrobium soli TaxID=1254399 RepID=UPI003AB05818